MYIIKDGFLLGDKITKEHGIEKIQSGGINYGKVDFEIIAPKDVVIRTMYSDGWNKKQPNTVKTEIKSTPKQKFLYNISWRKSKFSKELYDILGQIFDLLEEQKHLKIHAFSDDTIILYEYVDFDYRLHFLRKKFFKEDLNNLLMNYVSEKG